MKMNINQDERIEYSTMLQQTCARFPLLQCTRARILMLLTAVYKLLFTESAVYKLLFAEADMYKLRRNQMQSCSLLSMSPMRMEGGERNEGSHGHIQPSQHSCTLVCNGDIIYLIRNRL